MIELRPWQKEAVERLLSVKRCALWMDMGSGKTLSTLYAMNEINEFPVLVVAPLRVALFVWFQEVKKWFPHLKVRVLHGPEKDRKVRQKADIYVVNYEGLKWLTYNREAPKFKAIICDESSKLRGARARQGTVTTTTLKRLAEGVPRFIELTGTPAPQGLIDLWGQVYFLDKGKRLGANYTDFINRWFYKVPISKDSSFMRDVPHSYAMEQIMAKLRDICFTIRVSDYVGVDKPLFTNVKVALDEKAMGYYADMRQKAVIEMANYGTVTAVNAAVVTAKLQQIAQGAIYDEDGKTIHIHDEKILALDEIAEEWNGTPLLVIYNYKHDLERLKKAYPKGRELGTNEKTITAFNNGEIPMLFCHPKSAGHGINLAEGTHVAVFFSLTWDLELYQQVIERIGPMRQKQMGLNRAVNIYHIVAEKTVDERILDTLEGKANIQESVLKSVLTNV